MTRKAVLILVIGVMLTAGVVPARAHHSGAWFDLTKWVSVEGVVTMVKWQNPHMWVYLDKTDENGNIVKCAFEGPSAQGAAASGVSAKILKVGNHVVIDGHPNRDGSCGGDFEGVTVDGQKYYPRGVVIRK